MDDLLTGTNTIELAKLSMQEVLEILHSGSFPKSADVTAYHRVLKKSYGDDFNYILTSNNFTR